MFAYLLFQPMHGKGYGNVAVRVAPGSSATQIGDQLEQAKVVDSGFFFALRARLDGKRSKLRAGTFAMKKSMPYGAALTALTTPPASAPIIDVLLPEGPSRREFAPIVKKAGVSGSYLKASDALARSSSRSTLRRAAGHPLARGLPVPRHLRAAPRRRDRQEPRRQAAHGVQEELRLDQHEDRASARSSRATTC